MEARLCEMALAFCWHGRQAEVIAWLEKLGCKVVERPGDGNHQWTIRGSSGVGGALYDGLDPVTTAIMLALLFLGILWPHAVPGLLAAVDREWKRLKKLTHEGS